MTTSACPNEESELACELNLRNMLWRIKDMKEILSFIKLDGKQAKKELQAAKTGLTVAQSAIEELLK